MTFAVTMPALSDTMGAGRLVKWTKKVGDKISKGDVIAEVETDKAVMEVEAFQDGYLGGPLAAEGSEAPVGETIGYITDSPGEVTKTKSVAAPGPAGGDGQVSAAPAVKPSPVSAVLAASMSAGRPVVRPHMRPSSPPATGVESSQQYQPTPSGADTAIAAGPPYRLERASSAREAVARNMIASAAAPSFHVTARLPLQALMESAKTHGHALSVLLARACALTVKANPLFNAAYTSKGLAHRDRIDIGVALDSGEGLITPVLRDAAAGPWPTSTMLGQSCASKPLRGVWHRPTIQARHSISAISAFIRSSASSTRSFPLALAPSFRSRHRGLTALRSL